MNKGDRDCNEGGRSEIEECCTEDSPCDEGQGDCDQDHDCKDNLVCGKNNCDQSKFSWTNADCCKISGKLTPYNFPKLLTFYIPFSKATVLFIRIILLGITGAEDNCEDVALCQFLNKGYCNHEDVIRDCPKMCSKC